MSAAAPDRPAREPGRPALPAGHRPGARRRRRTGRVPVSPVAVGPVTGLHPRCAARLAG
jgi:hypothetical protein